MKHILRPTVVVILVLLSTRLFSSPFEGVIFFQKMEDKEVTFFRYYVKGDKVRIEDVNEGGLLNGILLIDLKEASLKMLSCSAQMYLNIPVTQENEKPKVKIDRTGNKKLISGKECELWKVENTSNYSSYEFWVGEGDYAFFTPMLKVINRNDNIALAWLSTMISSSYFPFEGVEYSSTGKEITKLEVIEIKEKELENDLFEIPANYTIFEKKLGQ